MRGRRQASGSCMLWTWPGGIGITKGQEKVGGGEEGETRSGAN